MITESVQKQKNYKIIWLRKVSTNRKIKKSLDYGKCPETGQWQNSLMMQNRSAQEAPTDLEYGNTEYGKCLQTEKLQNPLMVQNRSALGAPNNILDA